jgi:hypothetical protein
MRFAPGLMHAGTTDRMLFDTGRLAHHFAFCNQDYGLLPEGSKRIGG